MGLLSKLYIAPFIGSIVVVIVLTKWQERAWREIFTHLFIVGAVTFLIAGWWHIRNMVLYDDPTAAAYIEEAMSTSLDDEWTTNEFWELSTLVLGKAWAEGAGPSQQEAWIRIVSDFSIWLLIVGTVAVVQARYKMLGILFFAIVIPVLAMTLYGLDRNIHAVETQWVFRPALPIVSLFLAGSLLLWIPSKWRWQFVISSVILLGVLSALFLKTYIWNNISPISIVDNVADFEIENRTDIAFENGAHLVGYEISKNVVEVGETISVKLCWQAGDNMDTTTNYIINVELVLAGEASAAKFNDYPAGGRYPTVRWRPGRAYCESVTLPIYETVVNPRAYYLNISMFLKDGSSIPYMTASGDTDSYLLLERVTVYDPVRKLPPLLATIDNWGGITEAHVYLDAGEFELSAGWCALASAPKSYQYFWHAYNDAGELLGQADGQLLDGELPTNFWQANTCFLGVARMQAVEGTTDLQFGFYDPESGQRALWYDKGTLIGDHYSFELPANWNP